MIQYDIVHSKKRMKTGLCRRDDKYGVEKKVGRSGVMRTSRCCCKMCSPLLFTCRLVYRIIVLGDAQRELSVTGME